MIFLATNQDRCLKFRLKISLTYELLFSAYFTRLFVGYAMNEEKFDFLFVYC